MVFLQPALLWGALAVAIPVIIHFWYQKKGQTIAWAASRWLFDKTSLQHKGLRLDEILLLLLRCLLLILLVLILSKPIADWLNNEKSVSRIHLVEPDQKVTDNFRFELEEALKKGEKIFWIGQETEVKDISVLPQKTNTNLLLQNSILKADKQGGALSLYLRNTGSLADLPKIYVPGSFKLYAVTDSSKSGQVSFLELADGRRLSVDQTNNLLKVSSGNTTGFVGTPAHKGNIKVLLNYKNPFEKQTVQAALIALQEIYLLPFSMDLAKKMDVNYDWILTDQNIANPDPRILYVVSGVNRYQYVNDNVMQMQDSLRIGSSELVRNGQLPEWLGEIMVKFYNLKQNTRPLSHQQLNAMFVKSKPLVKQSSEKLHQWLLLIFVITLLSERWIALKKTAEQTYA